MGGGSKERMNEVTAVSNSSCHVDAVGKDETHSP